MHQKVQVVIVAPSQSEFYLLLLQTNPKRGQFWQNVTGSVEADEDFLSAAKRELSEETGFSLTENLIELDSDFHFTDQWSRKVHEKCFLAILDEMIPPQLDSKEHQDYRWIKVSELRSSNYKFPSNYQAFELSKQYLGRE
jgi:8-oxo-dGTP pyrophosphatase MutT (NUDIX family)